MCLSVIIHVEVVMNINIYEIIDEIIDLVSQL